MIYGPLALAGTTGINIYKTAIFKYFKDVNIGMGIMTVSVETDTEKRFRETAKRFMGEGKGSLGRAVNEAMEGWIRQKEQEEIRERALRRLEIGYEIGRLLYKRRGELHER